MVKHKVLTEKEIRIMHLLQQGFTNQDISNQSGVSLNTIKYHLKQIYRKLEVQNRAEAVFKFKYES